MSKLEKGQIPFADAAQRTIDNSIDISDLNSKYLIDTAFHSFPETWRDEAFDLVSQNKDGFMQQYGIMIPKSVEDDPDFDAADILAMNIACNRYALETVKNNLSDHYDVIIDRLVELPVMKMRIQSGEFNSVSEETSYDIAA